MDTKVALTSPPWTQQRKSGGYLTQKGQRQDFAAAGWRQTRLPVCLEGLSELEGTRDFEAEQSGGTDGLLSRPLPRVE